MTLREVVAARSADVEDPDDAVLDDQRYRELGDRAAVGVDVARILPGVADSERLAVGGDGADDALAEAESPVVDDPRRIAVGELERQLAAALVEEEDAERLVGHDVAQPHGDPLESGPQVPGRREILRDREAVGE